MGLMTMQAQVRPVRSRPTRAATLPAGVLPNASSVALTAPYSRVPFVLQPGPMRVVGVPGGLKAPGGFLGDAAASDSAHGLAELVGVLIVAGLFAAGIGYLFCSVADNTGQAQCNAGCPGKTCQKSNCQFFGMCCTFTC